MVWWEQGKNLFLYNSYIYIFIYAMMVAASFSSCFSSVRAGGVKAASLPVQNTSHKNLQSSVRRLKTDKNFTFTFMIKIQSTNQRRNSFRRWWFGFLSSKPCLDISKEEWNFQVKICYAVKLLLNNKTIRLSAVFQALLFFKKHISWIFTK